MKNKKKVILVTGGFGTIGLAVSKTLLKQGHTVLIVDTKKFSLNKFDFKFDDDKLKIFRSNFIKENEIKKILSLCIKKYKKIDALIHCVYPKTKDWGAKLEKLKQSSLNLNLNNHLGSTIILCKVIINQFLKQKKGKLILISSIMGSNNPKFEDYKKTNMSSPIEYSAIKAAIISITKYLAKFYSNKNININCISPGGIKGNYPKKFINNYKKNCNSKGLLDPIDVANYIKFLISEKSNFISGQNLIIDDGWSL